MKALVILFADRKSRTEKEIIDILTLFGANYISDKTVCSLEGVFTVVSEYKNIDLKLDSGVAVICDSTDRFNKQSFPKGIIGICEDTNTNALNLFFKNRTPVISCGMNGKNTITLSSLDDNTLFATLQRSVTDLKGRVIEPAEFKIKLNKCFSPFAVMASVAILLLNGLTPKEF